MCELRAIRRYLATREDRLPWLFISERGQPRPQPNDSVEDDRALDVRLRLRQLAARQQRPDGLNAPFANGDNLIVQEHR
jgi:hypothetical protein